MNNIINENDIKTNYIFVSGKNEEDLKSLLEDLKEYIVENSNNNIDLKTFNGIKSGYTKILTKYWNEKKIYVECVSSSNNTIKDNTNRLKENEFNKWKFIIYNVM